ncbi:hypothetical protein BVJ53_06760 [Lacticaseibacillus chiayiensis]|uniref:Uncharacterized protein n=1 Tax=Lacticaseibacillus chiayiensis TaxID=2100821 RepID=A0A4Q1U1B0_9LACO|nr:hypothetical protein BVJ53_06760 [Lacticaseibacillus chiayiensis]RXT54427.1 hypothetical protein CHT97_13155 [Lacticaseibacillus chiayiensis]
MNESLFYQRQLCMVLSRSITRSQSQKSTYKDIKLKWPKTGHLGLRPLTLRFLSAPARAQ